MNNRNTPEDITTLRQSTVQLVSTRDWSRLGIDYSPFQSSSSTRHPWLFISLTIQSHPFSLRVDDVVVVFCLFTFPVTSSHLLHTFTWSRPALFLPLPSSSSFLTFYCQESQLYYTIIPISIVYIYPRDQDSPALCLPPSSALFRSAPLRSPL